MPPGEKAPQVHLSWGQADASMWVRRGGGELGEHVEDPEPLCTPSTPGIRLVRLPLHTGLSEGASERARHLPPPRWPVPRRSAQHTDFRAAGLASGRMRVVLGPVSDGGR